MQNPNFIYIGTSKAGSTWIFNLLTQHPEIFMVSTKGTYFFDNHFERGIDWYRRQFEAANGEQVRGEISHSYLVSAEACQRINDLCPGVKLMVCLRNPIDRAFSSYLDRVKNSRFEGSFEQALEEDPILVDRGRYATHLKRYLDAFGKDRIHIAHFDDIGESPELFVEQLFEFLEVRQIPVEELDLRKRMPAGKPRSKFLSRIAKRGAKSIKALGFEALIGNAKKSILLRNLLYRQYTADNKPKMNPKTREYLKNEFRTETRELDQMLGSDFEKKWLQ